MRYHWCAGPLRAELRPGGRMAGPAALRLERMAVLSGLLTLIGQLTGVWQSVATPSGLLAVGALVLAGLLALAVARMAATAAALTVAPMRRRAAAIRQKSWSARFQRLTDPDAAGRARPRAPGAVPAAA
jgi:hypothetical protein